MLHGDRPMPVIPAPLGDRRQRSGIAALGRDLPDHVDPFARLAPDMGEAKEVERGAVRSRIWQRWLPRRDRQSAYTWKRLSAFLKQRPLPPPRIVHRYVAGSEGLS